MTDALAKVVAKVQKLRRLAERAGSPEEAATAAARAAELLARHQLSEVELAVDLEADRAKPHGIGAPRPPAAKPRRLVPWKGLLAHGLAPLFACRAAFHPEHGIILVGRTSDVEAVEQLYNFCVRAVRSACRAGLEERRARSAARSAPKTGRDAELQKLRRVIREEAPEAIWKRSFLWGCTEVVVARLREQHARLRRDASVTALAVLDRRDQEAEAEYRRVAPEGVKAKTTLDEAAVAAGRLAGENIPLDIACALTRQIAERRGGGR